MWLYVCVVICTCDCVVVGVCGCRCVWLFVRVIACVAVLNVMNSHL